ncbi:phosphoenolpyruvate carboxykinase (ATP) [Clostridium luticellarii]|jgi:phosphoenolpyruvate carboxykinase (ATP)|uniref:Phosphoenolpyruvate carboxykinase (ATP) n=1 Tax=Clostridium luticellarii TaxID=1691940 RepID=A0A2T0BQY1_9CLOT|nr:phosphoenolpyruvate carboxykinase (ATP) [Clostridium luticellarii]MCI1945947.1 phosphoenolpyruvate carboxykinase (ATP) [Clostridium luticellarii]MCI1969309.1 phosphoenolpyruvate carboxykinase (ATP) [Clostridium luticellarii]MCI2040599.1 phosphoenolpyruvate carboxykinase (ATP) [Clostridium luticellarii]PRR86242.1 Phosphoenolpyruvate carboxykinase [Clostridium luticellarii]
MNMDLTYLNIDRYRAMYRNLPPAKLIELSIKRNEGILSNKGALMINTGKYTGRSPKDRFIVRQKSIVDKINWGNTNLSIDEGTFDRLYNRVLSYLQDRDIFVFDGFVGALSEYSMPIRVICEKASQALFATQMFRRPALDELKNFDPEFNVIAVPDFKACGKNDGINSEAFILINFDKRVILIGGTSYCGEIKKSVFSVMNFLLPQKDVMPMHCSANIGDDGKTSLFFGLSGTGKTTLSADKDRKLIGDDEHGWCDEGVFNFEGGCYAKTIRLDSVKEHEIYGAIKFGTVLENVVADESGVPDYNDSRYTENTRAAYPIEYIENVEKSGVGGNPQAIIFLTADAFGVMPPICRLSKEAAMYHFMSGYTSKVSGTERGITEPEATFSACFGEPFMLMHPAVYARLLGEKINKHNTEIYMVNTGWIGGEYGVGKRIDLPYTRAMVKAALEGKLKDGNFIEHPIFKVMMPTSCPGVPDEILNPRNMWKDKRAYDIKAQELSRKFQENFKRFEGISQNIINAGPRVESLSRI